MTNSGDDKWNAHEPMVSVDHTTATNSPTNHAPQFPQWIDTMVDWMFAICEVLDGFFPRFRACDEKKEPTTEEMLSPLHPYRR